ncbi:hypothetical protein M422DRAFT_242686 [Sphaerobolus stellatus SS14]|nr:hypothetical protein M422DRAFT_242686 [Sphaerobolus stellatus SS14]
MSTIRTFGVSNPWYFCALVKCKLLLDLEDALRTETVEKLRLAADSGDDLQYRPRLIESPSRQEILRAIQMEETSLNQGDGEGPTKTRRSARLTGSVGVNMGLELEIRQLNLRFKLADHKNPTARQDNELEELRRKLMKALNSWYASLPEFMPPEALQEILRGLKLLAETEFMLRTGQANDALKKLREALGLKSFLIQCAQWQVDKWAEVYWWAWVAMGKLRDPDNNANHGRGRLKQLTQDDLVMLSAWMEQHRVWKEKGEVAQADAAKRGKGGQDLPWIWKLEFETGGQPDQPLNDDKIH